MDEEHQMKFRKSERRIGRVKMEFERKKRKQDK